MNANKLHDKALQNIRNAADQGKSLRLITYAVSEKTELRIKEALHSYLGLYDCDELHGSLYTVIKELLINAVKANFKNIYFESGKPAAGGAAALKYETALKLFRLEMGRNEAEHLERIAREKNISANLFFSCESGVLFIEIENPASMSAVEYENICRKLDYARHCENISDYFLEETDDPNKEGAGLGLILIIMILKSLGLGEMNFSIRSSGGITKAAITIPLDSETMRIYRDKTAVSA
ncbi:MAG: hypothetical protein ACRCUT_11085 [Spirochaetota bacterium]